MWNNGTYGVTCPVWVEFTKKLKRSKTYISNPHGLFVQVLLEPAGILARHRYSCSVSLCMYASLWLKLNVERTTVWKRVTQSLTGFRLNAAWTVSAQIALRNQGQGQNKSRSQMKLLKGQAHLLLRKTETASKQQRQQQAMISVFFLPRWYFALIEFWRKWFYFIRRWDSGWN